MSLNRKGKCELCGRPLRKGTLSVPAKHIESMESFGKKCEPKDFVPVHWQCFQDVHAALLGTEN